MTLKTSFFKVIMAAYDCVLFFAIITVYRIKLFEIESAIELLGIISFLICYIRDPSVAEI